MKPVLNRLALAVLLLTPLAASAHKAWILPSATTVARDQWVTVDAAVSNDLFYFNHVPLRLDGLKITAPDGSTVASEGGHTGKYRSVFDLHLTQDGTYRVALASGGLFANWTENGEPKRWRGDLAAFERDVPKDAKDLNVMQASNRNETFVTAGAPNDTALKPTNIGLELIPVTHPNDLYAGEEARFRFLIDGQPAAGLDVTVLRGGARYRDQPVEMKVKADAEGVVAITFADADMYWLNASVQDGKAEPPAKGRRAGYTATLEVLPP
jgi:uncharacterized GH25 family protein